MKLKILFACGLAMLISWQATAQTFDTNGVVVQFLAGSDQSGFANGIGSQAKFNYPIQLVADSKNNVFVWDSNNGQIRKITPDAAVSTFAVVGLGSNGKLAIDRGDNIFAVSGDSPYYLYKFATNGTFTRTNLGFISPMSPLGGFCVDSSEFFYLSDQAVNKIYRCNTNGVGVVFVGSGNPGYADLNGTNAQFNAPLSLACDGADNIYVWERGNYAIRRVDQNKNVTTFAGSHFGSNADGFGTNAVFGLASGQTGDAINQMCCDHLGNLFLACGYSVRKISATTNVVTLAGSFSDSGYINGPGNLARFDSAYGIGVSGGAIFVADVSNQKIRSITNNPPPQVVSPANLQLSTYPGLQITGTVGRTYQIQTSADMNSWSTKATIILSSNPFLWVDQNPVSNNKFYRALLLP